MAHSMMLRSLIIAVMLLVCQAKHFKRCGLVRELRRQGFPEQDLRNWVCLVENESYSSTDKVGHNHDGSSDYGLFQINDHFWCSHGAPGKDCHVSCADLLTDDITKASRCAKKIFHRHHFMAWYGWRRHCKGKPLPDISDC